MNSNTRNVDFNRPKMSDEALHGVLGDIVKKVSPFTEINPESIYMQSITWAATAIGSKPFLQLGANAHKLHMFLNLLGETGQGKGEGEALSKSILLQCDPNLFGIEIKSGTVSGQGIIEYLQRIEPISVSVNGVLHLSPPTPVLVVETEFGQTLKAKKGSGNSLGQTYRKAWDGNRLESLGREKNENHLVVKNYFLNVINHITPAEYLNESRGQSDHSDGFSNRFVFGLSNRVRLLPQGSDPLSMVDIQGEIERLRGAIHFAQQDKPLTRCKEAEALWDKIYSELVDPNSEHKGMLARGRVHVMKFAAIFALSDCSFTITAAHLCAAKSLWDYSVSVVNWLMSEPANSNRLNELADKILPQLQKTPSGLPRAYISRVLLGRNYSCEDVDAVQFLLERDDKIYVEVRHNGVGRPTEMWFAKSLS